MKHLGDITTINWFEVKPVDCVTGGSPCQDLSVAGKRAGLAGERSGLYMEQIRCIKELRQRDIQSGRTGAMVRPRFMVWENVPGAFSSNGGKDFAAVLEEAVKIVEPQAPSISVPDKGWPSSGCLADVDGKWSIAWRVHDAQFWGVPQRRKRIALVCDFGGMSAPEALFERKGLSGHSEEGRTPWQATPTDTESSFGTNDREGNRFQPVTYDGRGNGDGETVSTLTGDHENRITDYTSVVCEPVVYSMKSIARNGKVLKEQANPICVSDYKDPDVVAYLASGKEIAGTLMASMATKQCLGDQEAFSGDYHIIEEQSTTHYIVRRLTPLECERLQGYPDGWTDIGDWVDSKGKKRKAADSPRYKALGNSIALPFWFWLLRRISAQYERPATLGSLFDGIGGFPLCWERCNGKGTALWASEIEEFPMAVTKIRFSSMDRRYSNA